jgi:glutathione-regulated potassium-efflux system ancillary protein KefG
MARVLILFAHPALEKSRVHRRLVAEMPQLPGLTFHDLYEEYPTFNIDVKREQQLLLDHDIIVLQHPFFWYSTPPIVKQWEDLVLEHGWAYGSRGTALRGKAMLSIISTGGGASTYQRDGYNRYTIRELLSPIEQTAYLCKMRYLPPYLIQGTHRMTEADIDQAAQRYRQLLTWLHDDRIDRRALETAETLNDALESMWSGEVLA